VSGWAKFLQVVGSVLSGNADDGSAPVKVGGVYHGAAPTLVDGVRADLLLAVSGGAVIAGQDALTDGVVGQPAGVRISASSSARTLSSAEYLYNGSTWDRGRTPLIFKPFQQAVVAGTPAAIWTPQSGKKFRLMGYTLGVITTLAAILLKDAGAEILRLRHTADGAVASPPMGNGILSAAANNALQVDVSASTTVIGYVFGTEE
jgi:hypothetical protein